MRNGVKKHRVTLLNRGGVTLEVREDEPIYDACEAAGIQIPIACKYGGCITCAGQLISGKVHQPKGTALNRRQSQAGYILMCVARPRQDCEVEVGVETHASLYANPFSLAKNRAIVEQAHGARGQALKVESSKRLTILLIDEWRASLANIVVI